MLRTTINIMYHNTIFRFNKVFRYRKFFLPAIIAKNTNKHLSIYTLKSITFYWNISILQPKLFSKIMLITVLEHFVAKIYTSFNICNNIPILYDVTFVGDEKLGRDDNTNPKRIKRSFYSLLSFIIANAVSLLISIK